MITLGRRTDGTLDFTISHELTAEHRQELADFRQTLADLRTIYRISGGSDCRAVPEYQSNLSAAKAAILGAHNLSQCVSVEDGMFIQDLMNDFHEWLLWELTEHAFWSAEFAAELSLEW